MATEEPPNEGACALCGRVVSRAGMTAHLKACVARAAPPKGKAGRQLHLFVEDAYSPWFWLHLAVPDKALLRVVDNFLRDLWLECCGHLSGFRIGQQSYVNSEMAITWATERLMDVKLGKTLSVGQSFRYTYDYGTCTELKLRVVREWTGPALGPGVTLLARNHQPPFACHTCGALATWICTECVWDGAGYLCEPCAAKHECGSETLLPNLNSPRAGMCAYTGVAHEWPGEDLDFADGEAFGEFAGPAGPADDDAGALLLKSLFNGIDPHDREPALAPKCRKSFPAVRQQVEEYCQAHLPPEAGEVCAKLTILLHSFWDWQPLPATKPDLAAAAVLQTVLFCNLAMIEGHPLYPQMLELEATLGVNSAAAQKLTAKLLDELGLMPGHPDLWLTSLGVPNPLPPLLARLEADPTLVGDDGLAPERLFELLLEELCKNPPPPPLRAVD